MTGKKETKNWKLQTPVAFLIFNRPDTTEKVFAEIAKVRPTKLLVVADGPRVDRPGEIQKCIAARAIIDRLDWSCEVLKHYSETNLGCKKRVTSGLDWVFDHFEEAIILEDDCVPSPSFFRYCQELLERFRSDTRVMQICGFNRMGQVGGYPYSYYFSKYGPVWGWASWRRAWRNNDVDMKAWTAIKNDRANHFFCDDNREIEWRLSLYDRLCKGEIDTWDYQWGFAKLINSGLSVIPRHNLIRNIGFREDATHTKSGGVGLLPHKVWEMDFPLTHPSYLLRNVDEDSKYLSSVIPRSLSGFYRNPRTLLDVFLGKIRP
jgi:hypothetical protein